MCFKSICKCIERMGASVKFHKKNDSVRKIYVQFLLARKIAHTYLMLCPKETKPLVKYTFIHEFEMISRIFFVFSSGFFSLSVDNNILGN